MYSTIYVHFIWVSMTVLGRSIAETSDQCHRDSTHERIAAVVLFDVVLVFVSVQPDCKHCKAAKRRVCQYSSVVPSDLVNYLPT